MNRESWWMRKCASALARLVRGPRKGKSLAAVLREEGTALVEMALSCSVLFLFILGIAQMSLLFYALHFVSDAAREATRFAMVRGGACITNVGQTFCSPTDTNTAGADNGDIQAFVRGLGYPYTNVLSTTTTWYTISGTTFSSCGTAPSGCNAPGSMVQITAYYSFPLAIPFWTQTSVPISSTSAQVIQQ